ncbi:4,5-dihydroxyphthalate dehydrogenase [Noviherbaspirillum humi]|uniref:4,5-dihydroxyphthalate dehydrogenase n=1 Tax=Noviherbaspirillum humi TaxID=1688639 RepID=A0A239F366_9BURK|nr:Gfo/Idh/MocA family oxidoreductase [Noviherbaspirillum humi]SNS50544.1 4,5-dihydroxyphthalate dehydrogenase [Noviherbaspirillum humi]
MTASTDTASAASRRLRLGVSGLGRAFSLMLPTFLKEARIELVAACDPRETARAQFARDFNAPVYDDIDQLARDPRVEAIYIASPHQFHAEQTRVAARHGKHVLVEKPMALTVQECDAMIADCEQAGVYLIVGHCHSFDSPYLQARALIDSGDFGAVRMIHALNYTDFLYRPRRPEELMTEAGGGVVFSQAAHQVDVVRLLAGQRAVRVRAVMGRWDEARPTEGAYSALLWFENGAFASISYNGYGHFDSDEWCDWVGELGAPKDPADYGAARRRLAGVASADEEARLKNAATYGGPQYKAPASAGSGSSGGRHQHFGPVIVSCERADLRPLPDGLMVYGDMQRERRALPAPAVPRFEVIDELYAAIQHGEKPLHDGYWARATLEICLALLASGKTDSDVSLVLQ